MKKSIVFAILFICLPAQQSMAHLLRAAMEAEHFTVYEFEWWHFDYNDWREYPVLDIPFNQIKSAKAAGK